MQLVQQDNFNVLLLQFLLYVNQVIIYKLQLMEQKVVSHVLLQLHHVILHVLDSIQLLHLVQLVQLVQVFHVMLVQDMDFIQDQSLLLEQLQLLPFHVMHVQQELQHVHNHQLQMQLKIQFLYVYQDII